MRVNENYKKHFEEIYVTYYSRMKRFAQSYVIHEEDAENLVQDIFIDLWEKKADFSTFTNISGFLYLSLKNKCIDHLRHKNTEIRAKNEIQEEYNQIIKLKISSLEELDDNLLSETVVDKVIKDALDKLPNKCREIFIMNKFDGKKQKIIAEELNISIHTVESQMAIAYKKLKDVLKNSLQSLNLFF